MNKADILTLVKSSLGYPVVNVEVDDTVIEAFYNLALTRACDYSNYTEHTEVSCIPCQEFKALDVVRVYNNNFTMPIDNKGDIDIFNSTIYQLSNGLNDIKNIIIRQGYQNVIRNSINYGFKFIKNQLYLFGYTGRVTVEYIPLDMTVEQLESNLQTWVYKYTKCLCKEALGRIRGKYKGNDTPFEIDADVLLSEYSEERQQLEDELTSSQTGFFFVDYD